VLDQPLERRPLLRLAVDAPRAAEHDGGPVVHGVVVDRPCEHEPVEERRGHAEVDAALELA
jgi:hypothetical protein